MSCYRRTDTQETMTQMILIPFYGTLGLKEIPLDKYSSKLPSEKSHFGGQPEP